MITNKKEVAKKIFNLDLDKIKFKIINHSKNEKFLNSIDKIELDYKNFLLLNYLYPNRRNVPNENIDEFWHYHILDTKKYREDCESIFGRFLDHNPYFGLSNKEEYQELQKEFEETNKLSHDNNISEIQASFCHGGFEDKAIKA